MKSAEKLEILKNRLLTPLGHPHMVRRLGESP